jgi:pyrroline-5-carboxylate reductase
MGGALCSGLINAGAAPASAILISDPHTEHLKSLAESVGVRCTGDNAQVANESDIVVLAVKPHTVPSVLSDIKQMKPTQLLISIAAGVRIATIEHDLANPVPVIRAMPNTAAQVNTGACAYAGGTHASEADLAAAAAIFQSVGTAIQVDERMMDSPAAARPTST